MPRIFIRFSRCILLISLFTLAGCDTYMWRANIKHLDEIKQSGYLPKLNRDRDIEGPDVNQNGIRDDIDLYIEKNFINMEQRQAVKQLAMVLQESLLLDTSQQYPLRKIAFEKSRAIGCIYERFSQDTLYKPSNVVQHVITVTTNTKQRFKAYLAFSKAMDGKSITLPNENLCNE